MKLQPIKEAALSLVRIVGLQGQRQFIRKQIMYAWLLMYK
jgi:hypothetical protein